ncbi:MAG: hypothetical protein JEZ00_10595 [Anaerolineaceae bacterium]|nr:hypothetical protein [Anaerolineaceae bacterium]
MKKIWILITLMTLLLSACSTANVNIGQIENAGTDTEAVSAPDVVDTADQDTSNNQDTSTNGELPEIATILLGSFLLEDTENAITSEQAAALLPLWKGLNVLQNSETVTNQELEGLYAQIAAAMTTDQMAQINNMDISFDTMGTVMESLGLGAGRTGGPGEGGFADLTEEQIATMQAEREENGGGDFQGPGGRQGGRPDGGGDASMMAGGPDGDAAMLRGATTDSEGNILPEQAGDPSLRMMNRLFEPLIELLQSKIG